MLGPIANMKVGDAITNVPNIIILYAFLSIVNAATIGVSTKINIGFIFENLYLPWNLIELSSHPQLTMEIDLNKFVSERTNGDGFDRVYDCAGAAPVASCLLDVVKVRGQIVIVASYKKPTELPLFKGMAKEASINFVRVYRQKDFEIAAEMAAKEPLYEKIITHVLPAQKAQGGFDLLFTKGTGAIKVMFTF